MGATNAAAKTETAKKPVRKKAKAKTRTPKLSEKQRIHMIEEAAYFKAEQRGFQGGDPVADWLMSEKEVDDLLSQDPH